MSFMSFILFLFFNTNQMSTQCDHHKLLTTLSTWLIYSTRLSLSFTEMLSHNVPSLPVTVFFGLLQLFSETEQLFKWQYLGNGARQRQVYFIQLVGSHIPYQLAPSVNDLYSINSTISTYREKNLSGLICRIFSAFYGYSNCNLLK